LDPELETSHGLALLVLQESLHAQEVLLQSVDERDGELLVDLGVLRHDDEPEFLMDSALDAMRAEAQVNVALAA
jgi:hypothetical protein